MELYLTEAWSEARNSLQIVKLSSFTPVLQIRAFKTHPTAQSVLIILQANFLSNSSRHNKKKNMLFNLGQI